jgi:hypothetical protein
MTDAKKGEYIVFENWVELRRFTTPEGALFFQKFIKDFHPNITVRVFHETGGWFLLISDSDYPDQGMLTQLKGGKTKMMNGKENKPVKKFQAGGICAALWQNKMTLKDGRHIETLSVSLDRRYKDSDGEWKSSSSLKENDIPKAMLVLAKAYEFMTAGDPNQADDAAD